MDFSNLHYYVPTEKVDNPTLIEKNLIIYGGTPAGITAAIQATKWVSLLQSLSLVKILAG